MPVGSGGTKKKLQPNKVINLDKSSSESKAFLKEIDSDEIIFALDIGTRTVVGIVGIPEEDKLKVIATHVLEHKSRAMLDGQIHDISQVSAVVKEIKEILEKQTGIQLNKVAIAAAGRVLKTCEVKVEREIDSSREIDHELVSSIEIEGIQRAQMMLDEEISKEERIQFYCVGYSVINYYLNGYVVSKLQGHRAKNIGVDVLATFLPHVVVDSLYTVMNRVGLEVVSLTLEPIAAINVTIPKDLRLLNLALVDIGAGTSDIAVTKDGSVVAYAMVPLAGDEITEKISQHYLVDFNTGEKIKTAISSSRSTVSFTDILKKKHSIDKEEVIALIKPSIEVLGHTISQRILEYNHKAPNAVFLIGGGSRIPGLTEIIAHDLNLAADRVVVRGRDVIQNVKFNDKKLSGPESITPFGIAVTAQLQRGQDFLAVTVNGKKVRLFNSKTLTIADALILIGFNPGQLIGRSGKSLSFTLNGKKKIVRGEYGKAAEIYVNESLANLETKIKAGDDIKVIPAEDGNNAKSRISDYVEQLCKGSVTFNGSKLDFGTIISINGNSVSEDMEVFEGDIVEIIQLRYLHELLEVCGISDYGYEIYVNEVLQQPEYTLKDKDIIECRKIHFEETVSEEVCVSKADYNATKNADAKDEQMNTEAQPFIASLAGKPAGVGAVIWVNGKEIQLKESKSQHIFVDIFNYVDFDLTKPQGTIILRLNGKQAAFTEPIKSGDTVEIYWEA